MTALDPSRRIGRPTTPSRTGGTENDARVRHHVGRPTYTAADKAVAEAVRAKVESGVFDRNPGVKARAINLLATFDAATTGRLARVPDRGSINRIVGELRRINHEGAVRTNPSGGSDPPFEVSPVGNTDPPTRIREVKVEWDYGEQPADLAGFRLYHEGVAVGETRTPAAREMSWEVSLSEGSHSFTLTAFDTSGNESAHSAPAILNNVFPDD